MRSVWVVSLVAFSIGKLEDYFNLCFTGEDLFLGTHKPFFMLLAFMLLAMYAGRNACRLFPAYHFHSMYLLMDIDWLKSPLTLLPGLNQLVFRG